MCFVSRPPHRLLGCLLMLVDHFNSSIRTYQFSYVILLTNERRARRQRSGSPLSRRFRPFPKSLHVVSLRGPDKTVGCARRNGQPRSKMQPRRRARVGFGRLAVTLLVALSARCATGALHAAAVHRASCAAAATISASEARFLAARSFRSAVPARAGIGGNHRPSGGARRLRFKCPAHRGRPRLGIRPD